VNTEGTPRKLAIIGAGGIGSNLAELLIPALRRLNLPASITMMDDDVVEVGNLGHQRYTERDLDMKKVDALIARLAMKDSCVELIACKENLRTAVQLEPFDMVIVCVDRPEPRRLVHTLGVPWADLRCGGDGYVMLSSKSEPGLVRHMTPDHKPMSCQHPGALDEGNLEFGFANAASLGAQWALQVLRGQQAPVQSMGSLTYGAFNFPSVPEVNA
jgi:molybdopterin/thiamine biosynthesis adenylyltransferase